MMDNAIAVAVRPFQSVVESWSRPSRISGRSRRSHLRAKAESRWSRPAPKIFGTVAILWCVALMPFGTLAQSAQSSWSNLNALQAGQKIQVTGADSKTHSGTFVRATDSGLSLEEAGGAQTIQRQDVRSVKLMENRHRLRNTLIGAAVGAGAGAGITAGTWENHGFLGDKGTGAAVGAVIGRGGGGDMAQPQNNFSRYCVAAGDQSSAFNRDRPGSEGKRDAGAHTEPNCFDTAGYTGVYRGTPRPSRETTGWATPRIIISLD